MSTINVRVCTVWTLIGSALLALILIPFFLYETAIVEMTDTFLSAQHSLWWVAGGLGALLTADILLPVPSSVLSTACGSVLGFWAGTLVSWLGMTAGCVIGYTLGGTAGRPAVSRLAGSAETARVERVSAYYGHWMIILLRAVPVLAEASVVFAGISRMPIGRFVTLAALSNLGISMVYASLGSLAAGLRSFLLAFAAAVCVPAVAWLIAKRLKPWASRPAS